MRFITLPTSVSLTALLVLYVDALATAEQSLDCKNPFLLEGRSYNFEKLNTVQDLSTAPKDKTELHVVLNLCASLASVENEVCHPSRICGISDKWVDGTRRPLPTIKFATEAPTVSAVNSCKCISLSRRESSGECIDGSDDVSAAKYVVFHGEPNGKKDDATQKRAPDVFLKFSGFEGHQATVALRCNASLDDGKFAPVGEPEVKDTTLAIVLESKMACAVDSKEPPKTTPDDPDASKPKEPEAKGGMSGVGIFFLLLFLAAVAYLGIGVYYNHKVYGAHGWDLIPNADFWRELPTLIGDLLRHLYSSLFNRGNQGGYNSLA